jgi:putative transposase
MVSLLRIAGLLVEDAFRWVLLLFRSAEALKTENLFLRRQLTVYIERGVQPRRIDAATRVSLALLARRLFWRMKSRVGRPPIPVELRELIRRMARNVLWGEERIANELLLKLGIRISPQTVRKYLPKRPPGRPRGDLRWSTLLKSHARGILACDFFVAITATFRMLYVFVVIEHGTRRLAHMNVTTHPSAT